MKDALIGFTGFVGSNINNYHNFKYKYNSKNINEIKNKSFNLIVCAGAPAEKWKANQNPSDDLNNINRLIRKLDTISANKFILISTVDVYPVTFGVNENTEIQESSLHAYGKHRYKLEKFVMNKFNNHLIIRLPGLFGRGIKKNIIYDLLYNNALDYTHQNSIFQFYGLDNLWNDIQIIKNKEINLINFSTEPIRVSDLAKKCFGIKFANKTINIPVKYDIKTKYDKLFGKSNGYIIDKKDVIKQIKLFVTNYKEENKWII